MTHSMIDTQAQALSALVKKQITSDSKRVLMTPLMYHFCFPNVPYKHSMRMFGLPIIITNSWRCAFNVGLGWEDVELPEMSDVEVEVYHNMSIGICEYIQSEATVDNTGNIEYAEMPFASMRVSINKALAYEFCKYLDIPFSEAKLNANGYQSLYDKFLSARNIPNTKLSYMQLKAKILYRITQYDRLIWDSL